ncbi:HlyD family secretion protein [Pseudoalteromonas luteoviolacea]|uniref:HlyD family secretion protein n=1 Tax=Pseudoalteromonas luteoviolacea TaxID=43657 RepID=UPI001B3A654A|nr:efflux RND transporter periplasmic adaptor subunit [Pseudoalteromonas luteoviolacea]MBQ4878193.1 HlyD family secretion protein [Pseudoalteromonas luteoviolacea]MBQ4907348.1 HlyD family secretion protein [Pseudoalteromonas luteoviolacea]
MKKIAFVLLIASFIITGCMIYVDSDNRLVLDNAYVKGDIINITTINDGMIVNLAVQKGSYVKKGDLLFSIENFDNNSDVQLLKEELRYTLSTEIEKCMEINVAETKLKKHTSELDFSSEQKNIFTSLKQRNAISKTDLQLRELEEKLHHASLDLAKEEIKFKKFINREPIVQRANTQRVIKKLKNAYQVSAQNIVTAPYDGYVYDVFAYPGGYLERGDKALSFIRSSNIMIEANVLETRINRITPGQRAIISTDISQGERKLSGYVHSVVPSIAAEFSLFPRNNTDSNWIKVSQRVPVLIALDPSEQVNFQSLPIGTSVKVTIDDKVDPHAKKQLSSYQSMEYKTEQTWQFEFEKTIESIIAQELDPSTQTLLKNCVSG